MTLRGLWRRRRERLPGVCYPKTTIHIYTRFKFDYREAARRTDGQTDRETDNAKHRHHHNHLKLLLKRTFDERECVSHTDSGFYGPTATVLSNGRNSILFPAAQTHTNSNLISNECRNSQYTSICLCMWDWWIFI